MGGQGGASGRRAVAVAWPSRSRVLTLLGGLALALAAAAFWALPQSSAGGGTACSDPDIRGTNRSETLRGTNARETIAGFGGNDTIIAKSGPDKICGDAGDDVIFAGSGDDLVLGGSGSDQINGEEGSDVIKDPGTKSTGDKIVGESGDDVFKVGEEDGFCTCIGGDGKDKMLSLMKYGPEPGKVGSVFRGNRAIDTIFANGRITGDEEDDQITTGSRPKGMVVNSDDKVFGGRGDDTITPLRDAGDDIINGEDGLDPIVANGGDTVDGGDGEDNITTGGTGGLVTLKGAGSEDTISVVGAFNALVFGGEQADVINASLATSPVMLSGDVGPDTLIGGSANDFLFGGSEKDSLSGRGGDNDVCDGGSEKDIADETCEDTPNVP